jgi:hypothetical protein
MPCINTKRSCEHRKASLGKVRRAIAYQADHIGTSIVRHWIPAKKDTVNQSIAGEKQHYEEKKNMQEVSAHHYQMKRTGSSPSGSTSISIKHAARTRRSTGVHASSSHKKSWVSGR